jgi:COMPASS component SWD3
MNVLVSAQADGSLKHWHATSGKCLHARNDQPENHLFAIDFSPDGTYLASAGRDCHVRLYDESTKSLVLTLKEKGDLPGHSNRIFSVKFNQVNPNILFSGGWDNTMQVYDIREKGPVASIFGPHVCGDAIDVRNDGYTVLTGSYRQDDAL